jgi:hypothetical protein
MYKTLCDADELGPQNYCYRKKYFQNCSVSGGKGAFTLFLLGCGYKAQLGYAVCVTSNKNSTTEFISHLNEIKKIVRIVHSVIGGPVDTSTTLYIAGLFIEKSVFIYNIDNGNWDI